MHIMLFVCLLAFAQDKYIPHSGDLLFQTSGVSGFSSAIASATAQCDTVKYVHVGIVVFEEGKPCVIEATNKKGVTCTKWEDFMSSSPKINGNPGVVVKRLKTKISLEKAIMRAKSHLGEEYDWDFMPDNGMMYCSELVYESYLTDDNKHVFKARPMNFRDASGNMPEFWTELFKKRNKPIPEGVMGTNPNDMSKEDVLTEVYRFF